MGPRTANTVDDIDDREEGFAHDDSSQSFNDGSDHGYVSLHHVSDPSSIQQDADLPATPQIAQNENRAVAISRLLLISVLSFFTVGVAGAVFSYINTTEINAFEAHIQEASDKVFESIGSTLALSMGAADMLTVNLVSFAAATNMTWPYVTMPDHAVRLAKFRSLIGCLVVQQYQYVTDDAREEWEKYSLENGDWVSETLEVQKADPQFKGVHTEDYIYPTRIHYAGENTTNNTGPYAPTWQTYPKVCIEGDPIFNWNARQHPKIRSGIDRVIKDRAVAITEVINMHGPDISDETVDRSNSIIAHYTGNETVAKEPVVR